MKNSSKLTLLTAITVLTVFVSCKKEGPAGPIGPQGEQGVAGTDGENGDKGDKGDKGDIGTANVIYSDWLGADFEVGLVNYWASFPAPALTEEVLNTGEIAVYMREAVTEGFAYKKLNYSLVVGTLLTEYVIATPQLAEIRIIASFEPDAPDYGFRYVIIPGGVAASARAEGLDFGNFSQVAETFNIPK